VVESPQLMRSEAEDAVPQRPAQGDGLRSTVNDSQNVHRDKPSCKQRFGTELLHEHSVHVSVQGNPHGMLNSSIS